MAKSRNRILRRIILNISDKNAYVPDEIQTDDIMRVWDFINIVMMFPRDIKMIANSNDESLIIDSTLNNFLKSLNRYWDTINTSNS